MSEGLRRAMSAIAAAAADHSRVLDLRHLGLDAVPGLVGRLTWLEELYLDGNRLSELPESLAGLSGLAVLTLHENKLEQLPQWWDAFPKLSALSVSNNPLDTLPASMASLAGLRELYLSGTRLRSLPSWLGELGQLRVLSLFDNGLTNLPGSFSSLTQLTALYLDNNAFASVPPWLGGLGALTVLHLHGNRLAELPAALGNLRRLGDLTLHENRFVRFPSCLRELTALTTLSVYGNRLTELPGWLGELTGLTRLFLHANALTELPVSLGELTDLTQLTLRGNKLTSLPESLGRLVNLQQLSLDDNRLTELPLWLSALRRLRQLHASGNALSALPACLAELPELTDLSLGGNRLTELPHWLTEMTSLAVLSLSNNQLSALPDSWGALTGLRRLSVGGNRLATLPASIGQLRGLTNLSLYNNLLTELPESLGALTELRELSVQGNRLTRLPSSLGALPRLTDLGIAYNPLVSPPAQVTAGGTAAVLAFLRDSAHGVTLRQWTSKLLVVGEAMVGKTSLAKVLTGGTYDPEEGPTHGVHVDPLRLRHPAEPHTLMTLVVWDFGGQLEYRATQRFYLTDRSLFLLVWNSRARWRDGKITAWLDAISTRAPHSPVLIVATHGDEPSPATLPDDLHSRYPQVVGTLSVDAKSHNGVSRLLDEIRLHGARLPLMGVHWPRTWTEAAAAIRGLDGHAASLGQIRATMSAVGVRDRESQRALALALHDLGDVVFYADDQELSRKVILRPQWLDERITQILDSPQVAAARGVLSRAERDRLWADLDPDLHERLLRMMERFDLAYRTGDAEHSEQVALVVERLGDTRPASLDTLWNQALDRPGAREIGVVYKLASRQAGIPTWFIARQHRYTTGLHWSHGVLLHNRDPHHPTYALVTDDEREQPTITFKVRGRFPVHFLSVLIEAFENIIAQRYPRLIEQRLIPCACRQPPEQPCTYAFELDELVLEATDPDSDHTVRCRRSTRKIDARTMLDGLPGTGISTQIDELRHTLAEQNELLAHHTSTLERIDAQHLATLNGIRTLLARRAHAGAHCPSLFAVEELPPSRLTRRRTLRLSLWCEWPYAPDGPHPLPDGQGVYSLTTLPPWLRDYLPFLRTLATTLSIALPLITPALTALGTAPTNREAADLTVAGSLLQATHAPPGPHVEADAWAATAAQGAIRRADTEADFRTLRSALHSVDPQEHWGGLSAATRPEDHGIVYLCSRHVRALEYPYRP